MNLKMSVGLALALLCFGIVLTLVAKKLDYNKSLQQSVVPRESTKSNIEECVGSLQDIPCK